MICYRCGVKTQIHTMSRFNTDILCMECKEDERMAPGYARAERVEIAAVRMGNYNFPGVGLSAEDSAFLAERRALRKQEKKTDEAQ